MQERVQDLMLFLGTIECSDGPRISRIGLLHTKTRPATEFDQNGYLRQDGTHPTHLFQGLWLGMHSPENFDCNLPI